MPSSTMSSSGTADFLAKTFQQLSTHSRDGALCYICAKWKHAREVLEEAAKVFLEFTMLCVWEKERGEPGSLYRNQLELVFVFSHGGDKHPNNLQLGRHGRNRTNLWKYPRESSVSNARMFQLKPVALVADVLFDSSARGEIVLDPFLRDGTTLIAAQQTGRTCYGMDLDPRNVDLAVRRWQTFTRKSATEELSGSTFADLKEAAHAR